IVAVSSFSAETGDRSRDKCAESLRIAGTSTTGSSGRVPVTNSAVFFPGREGAPRGMNIKTDAMSDHRLQRRGPDAATASRVIPRGLRIAALEGEESGPEPRSGGSPGIGAGRLAAAIGRSDDRTEGWVDQRLASRTNAISSIEVYRSLGLLAIALRQ